MIKFSEPGFPDIEVFADIEVSGKLGKEGCLIGKLVFDKRCNFKGYFFAPKSDVVLLPESLQAILDKLSELNK